MYCWMVNPGAKRHREMDEAPGCVIYTKMVSQDLMQSSSLLVHLQMKKDSCSFEREVLQSEGSRYSV